MFEDSVIRDRLGNVTTLRSVITLIMPLAAETMRLQFASESGAARAEIERLVECVATEKTKFADSLAMLDLTPCDKTTQSHLIASAMEVAIFVADYAISAGDDPEKSWQQYLITMSSNRRED